MRAFRIFIRMFVEQFWDGWLRGVAVDTGAAGG